MDDWLLATTAKRSVLGHYEIAVVPVRQLGEDGTRVRAAVETAQRCNHAQNVFAVASLNAIDLQRHLEQILLTQLDARPLANSAYVDINRFTMNYLAAVRAYEHIVGRTLHGMAGPAPVAPTPFQVERRRLAETPGSYGFLSQLRNYAQHHWLPVSDVELNQVDTRYLPTPPASLVVRRGHVAYTLSVFLDRDHLLADYAGWQKPAGLAAWIQAQPQRFDLLSVVLEAQEQLGQLHDLAMRELRHAALPQLDLLLKIEAEVENFLPGSTPQVGCGASDRANATTQINAEHLPMALVHWIVDGCSRAATVAQKG